MRTSPAGRASLGTHLGVAFKSRSGVTTLSVFLSVDVRPRLNSITEKSMAQTGAPGTWGRLRDDDGGQACARHVGAPA